MNNWWKKIKAWFYALLIALGLAAPLALADDVSLSWTNATQNEDGSVLLVTDIDKTILYKQTFPLGTDVSTEPRSYVELIRLDPAVESYVDQNQPNGIHCYVGTHLHVNGNESVSSNEACKTVDVRIPGNPTGMTAS